MKLRKVRTRNEVPIGIWILTDDTYLRYFVWNSFQESGLGADNGFGNELPDQFKGLIVIVGYKRCSNLGLETIPLFGCWFATC